MIFLRPWFLLLLLVPFFFWWWRRKRGGVANPWKKYVATELLPYLTVSAQTDKVLRKRYVPFLITILWSLCVLALSGPAVDKLPTPAFDDTPATVVIADLNSLNDEKLNQLRVKLYELTERLKDSSVALVLYDSKGYVALPLTRDIDVLKALIPSLRPQVMPDVDNRLEKGVEQAVRLFKNAGKNTGRILIITGGTPDVEAAGKLIDKHYYQVGVLGLGSETTGTPVIRQNGVFLRDALGNLILVKPDKRVLSQLGTYRLATPQGYELDELLEKTKPISVLDGVGKAELSDMLTQPDVWRDLGVYLVLMCLPLMALLFRKGIFYIILILFFNVVVFSTAEAGFWWRPDQESYRTVKKGNEAYERGDYQTALKLYEQDSSEEALYNKGNALAHLKEYYQAIETYDSVLKKNPKHEDALFNKNYLEQFLKQEQQQSEPQKNDENQKQSSDEQDSDKQKNNKSQSDSDDQNSQADSQKNESEKQDNPQSDTTDKSNNENQYQNEQSDKSDKSDSSDGSANLGGEKSHQPDESDTQMSEMPSDTTDEQYSDKNDNSHNQTMPKETDKNMSSDSSDKSDSEGNVQTTDTEEAVNSDNSDSQLSVVSDGLSSDEIDQETQQIINRLQKDPSQVLKFRLRKQYLAQ